MNSAENFFQECEKNDIEIPAIEEAQRRYFADSRFTDPHTEPSRRKHDVSQGHLYLNKSLTNYTDFKGREMNRVPGVIFRSATVKEAERLAHRQSASDPNWHKYLSPQNPEMKFIEQKTQELMFHHHPELIANKQIATIPMPGVSVAFRELSELLKKIHPIKTVITGTNGYGEYDAILKKCYPEFKKYRHNTPDYKFDAESFEHAINSLTPEEAAETMLILQAGAYNYTGVNPTSEQMKKIVELVTEKGIFTFIDSAYPGMAKGLQEDTELIDLFAQTSAPFCVYESYGKKAQTYGHRLGFLHIKTGNEQQAEIAKKHLYKQIRENQLAVPVDYKMLYHLLGSEQLMKQLNEIDLPIAREIIYTTKKRLAYALNPLLPHINPDITQGMFNDVHITKEGLIKMGNEFGVYPVQLYDMERGANPHGESSRFTENGFLNPFCDKGIETARINMGGILEDSITYIAEAIRQIYLEYPSDK